MSSGIVLRGLDGSNPLGFLAALGTFRLATLRWPQKRVSMKWVRENCWRPELIGIEESEANLSGELIQAKMAPVKVFSEELGKNINIEPERFRKFVHRAANEARTGNRSLADFAAAFGCESCEDEDKGKIEYTALCFITGSGHQDFLGTMEGLSAKVTANHLFQALFGPWRAEKGLSMRWDPEDVAEYALQWSNPGPEGASSIWGANLLAVEALPLFPTQPRKKSLQTTGFLPKQSERDPQFTWPIWTRQASLDTARSLLSLAELQRGDGSIERELLRARGIEEVYRAPRVWIGQGRNRKVNFRPARAV
ncbi:MAG TPA: hypothetical protein VLI55_12750 [Bryobacteraceae bacterium]|nr:hypothetical protein [Bryobacteraceae bacterium]